MQIKLTSISPVSFMMAKEGDLLEIRSKMPRVGEFRSKIGSPRESLLVFKVKSKIGMIPFKIIEKYGKASIKDHCRVIKMDEKKETILIEI